jgi:hypothetical protein
MNATWDLYSCFEFVHRETSFRVLGGARSDVSSMDCHPDELIWKHLKTDRAGRMVVAKGPVSSARFDRRCANCKMPRGKLSPFPETLAEICRLNVPIFMSCLIKPLGRETRKHPPAQIRKLQASIEQFDFVLAIVVGATSCVIAGWGLALPAKKLGLREVPAVTITTSTML